MADTIERLYKLTVDGTQAARSLKNIEDATASMDRRMADSINGITRFAKQLAAAFAVKEIVGGFQRIIDSMDELGKDAQKIGIAVDELQRIRYAADLSGVSAEDLNKAMVKLSQAMSNLDDKGNKAAGVLRKFGVTQADDAITAMKKFADGINRMPEGFQKTADAADLFGKAVGTKMIPMLNAGGDAFVAMTKEAESFGGIISGKTAKQAEEFNDNVSRLARTAAGIGAQLTAGMLPALVAISEALKNAAKDGDGFETTGQKMGERIVTLANLGLRFTAVLQSMGVVLGSIAEAGISGIWSDTRKRIDAQMNTDLDNIEKTLQRRLKEIKEGWERAKAAFPENPLPSFGRGEAAKDPLEEAEKRAKAAREAEKRERERQRQIDILARQEATQAGIEDATQQRQAMELHEQNIATMNAEAKAFEKLTKATNEHAKSTEAQAAELRLLAEWFVLGTDSQRAYAEAQLKILQPSQLVTEEFKKQRDEIDILNEGIEGFANSASQNFSNISQAFRSMIQIVVTELLKFWAKKYIVEALLKLFGPSTSPIPSSGMQPFATGGAFDAGRIVPFARGGVVSSSLAFPMALMGESGPEAIVPLKRAANGDLGVQAQQAQVNVTVKNYADATVTTRRTGPQDLEIIVERTRQAIAADLLKGGNMVSKSFEQAYGIGRGAAAAY